MSEDTTVETETEAPEAEDEGTLFDRDTVH